MIERVSKHPVAQKQDASPARTPGKKANDEQNSLARMLALLDLFTAAAPTRSVTDLVNYLGTSRSTSYRYIKALHDAGLIEAVASGNYVLGPRIVEFDRQIRMTDPLYKSGGKVLALLSEKTGHSALLCALYSDSLMCIRDVRVEGSPGNLFSRGQRRPLFSGAASKIILPYVPIHRLRSIFKTHQRNIALAGLGTSWQGFRDNLAAMRKDGFVISHGEFNTGVFGISAPVLNADALVVGSIGIAGAEELLEATRLPHLCDAVKEAGRELSDALALSGGERVRPPRAFGSAGG